MMKKLAKNANYPGTAFVTDTCGGRGQVWLLGCGGWQLLTNQRPLFLAADQ